MFQQIEFSLECFVGLSVLLVAALLQQRMDMIGTVWLSHSIATIKSQLLPVEGLCMKIYHHRISHVTCTHVYLTAANLKWAYTFAAHVCVASVQHIHVHPG